MPTLQDEEEEVKGEEQEQAEGEDTVTSLRAI